MNQYKISNQLFDLGLTPGEASVYAYLLGIWASMKTLHGHSVVSVKQSTIAEKCRIRSLQTVRGIMTTLRARGLVEPVERCMKRNKHRGTYQYEVKPLPLDHGYFTIPRRTFDGTLNPRQMYVYLFLCKAESLVLHRSWNSYNDIARQIGMKRELVIQTINELVASKHIVRMHRKARENTRVYVDNHYQIIRYMRSHIRRRCRCKGKVWPHYQYDHTRWNKVSCVSNSKNHYYSNTFSAICQVFFSTRGSPYFVHEYILPKVLTVLKRKKFLYCKYNP